MKTEEQLKKTSIAPQWSRIGFNHHHGIDIPLNAIHSDKSCGCGEFHDLIPLIDWCHEIGLDVIQLLPLNDTGDDPSPYFALSAMALSPLYLSLHKLPGVKASDLREMRALNREKRVPYHSVQSNKLHFLRNYFERMGSQIVKEKAFVEFVDENEWVESYALFKVLKDRMAKNHWQTWPLGVRKLDKKSFDALIKKHWNAVCFYVFLQYLCYSQLKEVKEYANRRGVFLKGDIPILISPDSADVWRYSEEFDLSFSAGAPPDAYSAEGQVWGLPIFRWEVMRERNYDWWKTRLSYAEHFYDIYRIDHVLGFYRIWAIPNGAASTDGQFIPAEKANWLPHGREILSVLCDHSKMLPIAEDLGAVPDAVRSSLTELGICGTRVVRWEKHPGKKGAFINPMHYNPVSMSTVSTHDSETLALWWKNEPKEAKAYAEEKGWDYTPAVTKQQRREMLWDSHHSSSLFHINLLGEYLALFPELVWEDDFDERINVPGTVSPHNWTYRVRPTVEEILAHKPLKKEMKNLIE